MGVYTRFKRGPEGFRALVELLETTPLERRQRMLDVGMAEDADFTRKALEYVMSFDDITRLSDPELAELMAAAPPRIIACAIANAPEEVQNRFLKCCTKPKIRTGIKEHFGVKFSLKEIGGARLKLVEHARKLEKIGYIRTKKIPV
jgi:flagellar motor switch protein FliG